MEQYFKKVSFNGSELYSASRSNTLNHNDGLFINKGVPENDIAGNIQQYLSKQTTFMMNITPDRKYNGIDNSKYGIIISNKPIRIGYKINSDTDFIQLLCNVYSLYSVHQVYPQWNQLRIYKTEEIVDTVECEIPEGLFTLQNVKHIGLEFISAPLSYINGEIYIPEIDNDTSGKDIYLLALFLFCKGDSENSYLQSLLSGFHSSFKQDIMQSTTFEDFYNTLILSQYPSLIDYTKSILSSYRQYIKPLMYPASLYKRLQKVTPTTSFKSDIIESIFSPGIYKVNEQNEREKRLYESFKKQYDELLRLLPDLEVLLTHTFYKYPIFENVYLFLSYSDLNRCCELLSVIEKYHLYLLLRNRNYYVQGYSIPFDDINGYYRLKRCVFMILYPFYYRLKYGNTNEERFNLFIPVLKYLRPELKEIPYNKNNEVNDLVKIVDRKVIKVDYIPPHTLSQIGVIKTFNKKILTNMILKVIFKNYKRENYLRDIEKIIFGYRNDYDFYEQIRSLKNFKPIEETDFDKGEFRVKELESFRLFERIGINPKTSYLDFGGGIGHIPYSIASKFYLQKKNVYVTDIQNWFGKEHTEEYSNVITYRYIRSDILPFENNMFDFISCFQVLHHLGHLNLSLREIYRILKPGGYLLLREHNCETNQDRYLMDLEHSLYTYIMDDDPTFLHNYNDKYYSKGELFNKLREHKFTYVKMDNYPEEKGPTRYYYSLWTK